MDNRSESPEGVSRPLTSTKGKKKNFTLEDEEMIIEHYQQHEFLWNPKHENYKFGWKSTSVQDLATALGNKYNASEIHARFSAMRTTYRLNSNKVSASTTGSSATDVYVPTWPHYESLKFLDATQPTRTATTSYTVQGNDNSEFTDFESLDEYPLTPDVMAIPSIDPPKGRPPKSKKPRNEEVMDECLGVLRTVVDSANKENDQAKDRCQHFGDFVASSLREMTPWCKSCAMTEISNILLQYDQNNPNSEN